MNEEIESFFDLKRKASRFSQIEDRLNLQDIAFHIRDGGSLGTLQKISFDEREKSAAENLENQLKNIFDEETIQELLPIITEYTSINEDIHFTIGMKVGARLLILLTGNFESDF